MINIFSMTITRRINVAAVNCYLMLTYLEEKGDGGLLVGVKTFDSETVVEGPAAKVGL